MPSRFARVAPLLMMLLALAGCAARRSAAVAATGPSPPPAGDGQGFAAARGAHESLEHYMGRIRALTERAAADRRRPPLLSVEAFDPALRRTLAALAVAPTPARHCDVAAAYIRVGIRDRAFDHYTAATRLDRENAAAYDGLARLWRDWGWPHLALVEAHRAVYHAPRSPALRNTLGTVLQALGQPDAARREYEAALRLDPRAAYALNNVCTLELAAGRLAEAQAMCQRALDLDPTLLAARRNVTALDAARGIATPRTADTALPPGTPAAASGKPPGE